MEQAALNISWKDEEVLGGETGCELRLQAIATCSVVPIGLHSQNTNSEIKLRISRG